jgi:glutathione S-transferase
LNLVIESLNLVAEYLNLNSSYTTLGKHNIPGYEQMIDLYTFTTPNGRKASIMLEEIELPYHVHKIDITKQEQFSPEYIAINPNSKIPAIADQDIGITVFESGAILIYLAEKTGKLLPSDQKGHFQVLEWLMFQMGGFSRCNVFFLVS